MPLVKRRRRPKPSRTRRNAVNDAVGKEVTKSTPVTEQWLPLGPAASQIAIKQLGTNGGGYYGANSAYPYENPTPLSNFLELLAILLIPAALCYTFGKMVGDRRQGWALLIAMLVIFVPLLLACTAAEQAGNPALTGLGVDQTASAAQAGGNMEGKETRFGIVNSTLWASATTAASNGSVNAMHDSFTPLGGLVPMWLIELGEVIFGGVGSGLYGMLAFAVVAVFIAGLMVGRTPEYLGKKIEAYEMKMASLVVLIPCALVVIGTAIAVMAPAWPCRTDDELRARTASREILYASSSASNNNGSAFGGLNPNFAVLQRDCSASACFSHASRWRSACSPSQVRSPRKNTFPRLSRHAADAYAAVHRAAGEHRRRGRCADVPSRRSRWGRSRNS